MKPLTGQSHEADTAPSYLPIERDCYNNYRALALRVELGEHRKLFVGVSLEQVCFFVFPGNPGKLMPLQVRWLFLSVFIKEHKMNTCKKCNSANLHKELNGPHLGLYCSECGAWQMWLKQPQNIETNEIASDEQKRLVFELLKRWEAGGTSLTKRQAGAIISVFKE